MILTPRALDLSSQGLQGAPVDLQATSSGTFTLPGDRPCGTNQMNGKELLAKQHYEGI